MESEELNIAPPPEPQPDPETVSRNRHEAEWKEHVLTLLREERTAELVGFLNDLYASDVAHLLERLDFHEGRRIFLLLDPEHQGEVLHEIEDNLRERYLEDILEPEGVAKILVEQASDEAADLLEEIDIEVVSEILSHVPHEDRVKVTELLSYPENTAGGMMAKEFVAVRDDETVKKAINSLRKMSKESDEIHNVYVVDKLGRYKGHVRLDKLILARPQTKVKRIMEGELLPIPVLTDQEEVAQYFTRYDFITAPVIDEAGALVGRITVDDVLEVIEEEATEDIQRMGGVSGEEKLTSPLLRSSLQRIGWLGLNLATAFLSAAVIGLFETTINQKVILAALMPIVAGMGGNAGAQSMALVIRNIALGELSQGNTARTLRREALIGLINGLSIGALTGLAVFAFTGELALGGVIFLALLFNLVVAATAGTLVPVFLRRINIDPAIGSSILVTTCTDVMGFLAFLGFAYLAISHGMI
ncbi:MAG: magnesium transporter [bacterium]|nr:magnesium transporter [bacterium]